MHLPKVLVVAPLSGHFPILLRDLVIGLLPAFQVFITDWVNARHVALEQGPFDLDRNISYVIEMMERLGSGLNVMALCQGALPALLATAYLAEKSEQSAPRTLVLVAAPVDPAENPTRVVSPDHGAIPLVVRAQRHCSGAGPMSGKRPSHLPWFCPALGPAGLPRPPPVPRRRAPQKDAPRRWRRSLAIPVPRSLFDADGPSGRSLPRHRSPHLPRTLGLEVRAFSAQSASGLQRRSGRRLS